MVIPISLHCGHQTRSVMRRIIERVVTVVTTTTWKISWETDTPRPDPSTRSGHRHPADSVSNELPSPDAITQTTASVIEIKEVDPSPIESVTNPKADEPSNKSYPSKIERKSKS